MNWVQMLTLMMPHTQQEGIEGLLCIIEVFLEEQEIPSKLV